jgi:hypothetical protein
LEENIKIDPKGWGWEGVDLIFPAQSKD